MVELRDLVRAREWRLLAQTARRRASQLRWGQLERGPQAVVIGAGGFTAALMLLFSGVAVIGHTTSPGIVLLWTGSLVVLATPWLVAWAASRASIPLAAMVAFPVGVVALLALAPLAFVSGASAPIAGPVAGSCLAAVCASLPSRSPRGWANRVGVVLGTAVGATMLTVVPLPSGVLAPFTVLAGGFVLLMVEDAAV